MWLHRALVEGTGWCHPNRRTQASKLSNRFHMKPPISEDLHMHGACQTRLIVAGKCSPAVEPESVWERIAEVGTSRADVRERQQQETVTSLVRHWRSRHSADPAVPRPISAMTSCSLLSPYSSSSSLSGSQLHVTFRDIDPAHHALTTCSTNIRHHVRFEVFAAVTVKNGVFWDIKTQSRHAVRIVRRMLFTATFLFHRFLSP
jgi:hypothetical protein